MKCCVNRYVLNSLINVPPDPLAQPAFYVYEVGIDYTGFGGANFVAEITIDGTVYSWVNNPQGICNANIGGSISNGVSIATSLQAAFCAHGIDLNTFYTWGGNDRNGIYSFGGIVTSEPHTITISYDKNLAPGPYTTDPFVYRVAVPNLCATHTGVASVDTLLEYAFVSPVNTGGTSTLGVLSSSSLTVDNIEFDILTPPHGLILGLGTLLPSYTIVQNGGTYDITFTNFFMNLTDVVTDNGTFFPTSC